MAWVDRGRTAHVANRPRSEQASHDVAGAPGDHELNTAVWLDDLSRGAGRRLTLADLSRPDWAAVTRRRARRRVVDGRLGAEPGRTRHRERQPGALARFPRRAARSPRRRRHRLAVLRPALCRRRALRRPAGAGRGPHRAGRRGAYGSSWTTCPTTSPRTIPGSTDSPELFVHGAEDDLGGGSGRVADGRRPGRRARTRPVLPALARCRAAQCLLPGPASGDRETLADIAAQCDGIRCDMAMLMINRVFAATWGERAGPEPRGSSGRT